MTVKAPKRDYHAKGMRLAKKARQVGADTPHARRLVRRMLRLWARGHAANGAPEIARVVLRDCRDLH